MKTFLLIVIHCMILNFRNTAANDDKVYKELLKIYAEQLKKVMTPKIKGMVLEGDSATFSAENIIGEITLHKGSLEMDLNLVPLGYDVLSQSKNKLEVILKYKIPKTALKYKFTMTLRHIGSVNGTFEIASAGLLNSSLEALSVARRKCTYKGNRIDLKFDGYQASFIIDNGATGIDTILDKARTYTNTFNIKKTTPVIEKQLSELFSEIDVLSKTSGDKKFLDGMERALCRFN